MIFSRMNTEAKTVIIVYARPCSGKNEIVRLKT